MSGEVTMGDDTPKKKVDESWKDSVEEEKHQPAGESRTTGPSAALPVDTPTASPGGRPTASPGGRPTASPPAGEQPGSPEARFDLFISGLAMETLIALGEAPHPVTRKRGVNVDQARYLIDLLGILEAKTRGNLSVEENRLLKDSLYQLRMRYLQKAGG